MKQRNGFMIFKNCVVNGVLTDIVSENGKIKRIGLTDEQGVDLNKAKVFPGLIDIHTHGCLGHDTMDGNGMQEMSVFLAKNGVTSFLPTTMTMDAEKIKSVVNAQLPNLSGAQALGFHLEGPYISKKRKGAQNEKYIKNPDIEEFRAFKNVKMVTVAPELPRSLGFIEQCDAIVSIGHTDANYDETVLAFEHGAKCLTHTFNAMPAMNHREPGPVGAAIDKNAFVQVICDGLHIHKSVIKMLYRTFTQDRMILISDSMRATGLKDGEYEFGGQQVTVCNCVARLNDGSIAGSTSTLLDCVKKAIGYGIPEQSAFNMASLTPAKLLDLNKGRLEEGYDCDFIAVDEEYNVKMTVICGTVVYG